MTGLLGTSMLVSLGELALYVVVGIGVLYYLDRLLIKLINIMTD